MHFYIHAYGNVVDPQESKKKKRERFTNKKNHITKKNDKKRLFKQKKKEEHNNIPRNQDKSLTVISFSSYSLFHYIYNILFLLPFFFCISVSDSYDDPSSFPFFSLFSPRLLLCNNMYAYICICLTFYCDFYLPRTSFVLLQFSIKFVLSKVSTAFSSLFLFSRTTARCVEQIRLTVRAKMENGEGEKGYRKRILILSVTVCPIGEQRLSTIHLNWCGVVS